MEEGERNEMIGMKRKREKNVRMKRFTDILAKRLGRLLKVEMNI